MQAMAENDELETTRISVRNPWQVELRRDVSGELFNFIKDIVKNGSTDYVHGASFAQSTRVHPLVYTRTSHGPYYLNFLRSFEMPLSNHKRYNFAYVHEIEASRKTESTSGEICKPTE